MTLRLVLRTKHGEERTCKVILLPYTYHIKKKIEKLGFGRGVRERKFIRHNTLAVSTYEKVTGWLAVKVLVLLVIYTVIMEVNPFLFS